MPLRPSTGEAPPGCPDKAVDPGAMLWLKQTAFKITFESDFLLIRLLPCSIDLFR